MDNVAAGDQRAHLDRSFSFTEASSSPALKRRNGETPLSPTTGRVHTRFPHATACVTSLMSRKLKSN